MPVTSKFSFSKMHGLGNDFVVIDNRQNNIPTDADFIKQIADRNFGIGCDQVLMVTKSSDPNADFGYTIFNQDGSAIGQCGNGARCLAHFAHHHGISDKTTLSLVTSTTQMQVTREQNGHYSISMPAPSFAPEALPFQTINDESQAPFSLEQYDCPCYIAYVGNPHAIFALNDVGNSPDFGQACALSTHQQFPKGANISFMKILSPEHISLAVYERGAGTTLACGSAACAAMTVGRTCFDLAEKVTVSLPGGDLTVSWPGDKNPILLTGPSTMVFHGQWTRA